MSRLKGKRNEQRSALDVEACAAGKALTGAVSGRLLHIADMKLDARKMKPCIGDLMLHVGNCMREVADTKLRIGDLIDRIGNCMPEVADMDSYNGT